MPCNNIIRFCVCFYSAALGERSIAISLSVCLCVCLSASISLEPLDRPSRNFLCRSPVAVARSSSGGVAIRHVLPVLWMTSRLAVVGRTAMRGRLNLNLLPYRWRRCDTGAESDVYECLVSVCLCLLYIGSWQWIVCSMSEGFVFVTSSSLKRSIGWSLFSSFSIQSSSPLSFTDSRSGSPTSSVSTTPTLTILYSFL